MTDGVFASYLVAVACIVYSIGALGRTASAYSPQQANLVSMRTIMELARFEHLAHALRQVAGNVVLFVPLGIMLPNLSVILGPFRRHLVAAAAASAEIEILQLVFGLAGLGIRSIDIDDVSPNTLGGVLGWVEWRGAFARRRAVGPCRMHGLAGEEAVNMSA